MLRQTKWDKWVNDNYDVLHNMYNVYVAGTDSDINMDDFCALVYETSDSELNLANLKYVSPCMATYGVDSTYMACETTYS